MLVASSPSGHSRFKRASLLYVDLTAGFTWLEPESWAGLMNDFQTIHQLNHTDGVVITLPRVPDLDSVTGRFPNLEWVRAVVKPLQELLETYCKFTAVCMVCDDDQVRQVLKMVHQQQPQCTVMGKTDYARSGFLLQTVTIDANTSVARIGSVEQIVSGSYDHGEQQPPPDDDP